MTTSSETRTFPPKILIPEGQWFLAKVYKAPTEGKPFEVTRKNKQTGKPYQATVKPVLLHFRLADQTIPAACGQPHIMNASDVISDDSALYAALVAVLGKEKADSLKGLYVFDARTPEKLVPAETWAPFTKDDIFVGVQFKAARKNDDGSLRLDKDGNPFQLVGKVESLQNLRWSLESVKLWPPPKREQGTGQTAPSQGVGQPRPAASQENPRTPGAQTPPQGKAAPAQETQTSTVLAKIQALLSTPTPCRKVANYFLHAKGIAGLSALSKPDQEHLFTLLRCQEHMNNGGVFQVAADSFLKQRGAANLWELNTKDTDELFTELEDLVVPF